MSDRKGSGTPSLGDHEPHGENRLQERQRPTLPRFGLAEDIVGSLGKRADAQDPERVYTFADELDAVQAAPEAASGPAPRFETWITFGLADETYALPVSPVREVLRVSTVTRVPHAPKPIRGVTQHRGRVIPVIDVRLRLGLPEAAIGRQSRILVAASRRRRLGMLVDQVFQVVQLDLNLAQAPPEDVVSARADFISSVYDLHDDLLLMLDVDRVLVINGEDRD